MGEVIGAITGLVAVAAPFLMVVGIIWVVQRGKLEKQRLETTAGATAEMAAQYASQVQRLEDRVQVLERIVTDRGYDIATQIEALRDTRSVEQADNGVPMNLTRKENV